MILAAVSTSSNTVAVAALLVAAIVGFGGPLIQSRAADRRQKKALDAAKDELSTRLSAESDRLAQTLAAEHRKARYESERDALDAGAVFLQRFRARMDRLAPAIGSPEMTEMSEELGTQLARLRLWFSEDSRIIQAFQKMLVACAVHALERGHPGTYDVSSSQIQEEVTQFRVEYLDAAREHLSSR